MSDTPIIPPPNVFIADATGIALWRAELDDITIRPAAEGVVIRSVKGGTVVTHTVPREAALHLARLIEAAAHTVRR